MNLASVIFRNIISCFEILHTYENSLFLFFKAVHLLHCAPQSALDATHIAWLSSSCHMGNIHTCNFVSSVHCLAPHPACTRLDILYRQPIERQWCQLIALLRQLLPMSLVTMSGHHSGLYGPKWLENLHCDNAQFWLRVMKTHPPKIHNLIQNQSFWFLIPETDNIA